MGANAALTVWAIFMLRMEDNTFGPLRVVQQFYALLEKGTRKLIINILSEAGKSISVLHVEGCSEHAIQDLAKLPGSPRLQGAGRTRRLDADEHGWARGSPDP
jgi:hypothetical protein